MTDLAMATEAICSALNDTWLDLAPMDWPNVVREGAPLSEGNEPWAALSIIHGGGGQASMGPVGGRNFDGYGQAVVRIFVPAGKRGQADADSLAKRAVEAFRGRTVDGVTFHRVGPRTVGQSGAWWQVNVEADFEFTEVA